MQGFETAYNNIKQGDIADVRHAIMASCQWNSRSHFTMKKKGDRGLTPEEAENIRGVFAKYGIDAETGEEINQSIV